MIIRNIGKKIVSIGTTILTPDMETTVSEPIANTPAVRAMVRAGFLDVQEEPAEAPVREHKSAKGNTSKKAAKVAEKAAEAPREEAALEEENKTEEEEAAMRAAKEEARQGQ